MKEEEKLVQPQEELLDTEPKKDENDKIQKRIVLYQKKIKIKRTHRTRNRFIRRKSKP